MHRLKFWLCLISLGFYLKIINAESLDQVVAIVNNHVITQSELQKQLQLQEKQAKNDHTNAPAAQKVLQQMIDVRLQLDTAKKAGISVSNDQLNQTIAQIAQRNGLTIIALKQQMQHQGINFEQYTDEIRQEIILNELQQQAVAPQIKITPQEIDDIIQTQKLTIPSPQQQYQVLDILIPVHDQGTAADFAAAAQKANQLRQKFVQDQNLLLESNKAIVLNRLPWGTLNSFPDLFVPVIQNLTLHQFSAPIKAENGYHILQLLGVKGQRALPSMMQANVNVLFLHHNRLITDAQLLARAELLRQQILASGDFASIARNNSQEPNTAHQGGAMGWINPGELPPQVDTQINQLAIQQVSPPIITPEGIYLVQLMAKRVIQNPEMVQKMLAQQMIYQRKYTQALAQWLQALRTQSYIKILLQHA